MMKELGIEGIVATGVVTEKATGLEKELRVFVAVGGFEERETLRDMLPMQHFSFGQERMDLAEFIGKTEWTPTPSPPAYMFMVEGEVVKVLC